MSACSIHWQTQGIPSAIDDRGIIVYPSSRSRPHYSPVCEARRRLRGVIGTRSAGRESSSPPLHGLPFHLLRGAVRVGDFRHVFEVLGTIRNSAKNLEHHLSVPHHSQRNEGIGAVGDSNPGLVSPQNTKIPISSRGYVTVLDKLSFVVVCLLSRSLVYCTAYQRDAHYTAPCD